jgi:hypothetical protein
LNPNIEPPLSAADQLEVTNERKVLRDEQSSPSSTTIHTYVGEFSAHFHRNQPVGENLEFRRDNVEGGEPGQPHQLPPIVPLDRLLKEKKRRKEERKMRRQEERENPKGAEKEEVDNGGG